MNLSAEGIERLETDCGAGFLKVSGVDGLGNIEVTADNQNVGSIKCQVM